MPLYGFKCSACNRHWETYRSPEHIYSDYCCGVEAKLEEGITPKAMALETFESAPALQLHKFTEDRR